LEKTTSYEALHYVVFSNLLSLHLSLVQIFSSTPCSFLGDIAAKYKAHVLESFKVKAVQTVMSDRRLFNWNLMNLVYHFVGHACEHRFLFTVGTDCSHPMYVSP
jgi:hypothetical protein